MSAHAIAGSDARGDPGGRTSSLRARRTVQLRDELVAVATDLFLARGYSAVTVEDVAAAAGVAARTVYRHFRGGKEELALDPLREPLRLAAAALHDRADPDPMCGITAAVRAARVAPRGSRTRDLAAMVSRDPLLAGRHAADGAILEGELTAYLLRSTPNLPRLRAALLAAALVAALRTAYRMSVQSEDEAPLDDALRLAEAVLATSSETP